jgi:hypothetical protein
VNLVWDFCQGQAPTKWEIEASPDGVTNWTTVASSGSSPIAWSRNDGTRETHLVTFSTSTANGLRLRVDSANLSWGSHQIDEVEVAPATALQIWTCLNDPQQQWVYTSAREMMVSGYCLDTINGGTAVGTQMSLYYREYGRR